MAVSFNFTTGNYTAAHTFPLAFRTGGDPSKPPVVRPKPVFKFTTGNYDPAHLFTFELREGGGTTPPEIHRYVSVGFCTKVEEATLLTSTIAAQTEATLYIPSQIEAARETALRRDGKLCSEQSQSLYTPQSLCTALETAQPLSNGFEARQENYTHTPQSLCGTVAQADYLSHKIEDNWQQLDLSTASVCSKIEDAGLQIHDATRSYYDFTGIDYDPIHVFRPKLRAWQDDGRTPAPAPPSRPFTFTPGNYDPAHIFRFGLRLQESPRPVAPNRTPPVFKFNGVSTLITVLAIRQRSPLSGSACGGMGYAEYLSVKTCAVLEEAVKALSGTSILLEPPRPPVTDPPGHTTTIIPSQQVYIMHHILSVALLNGTPILMNNVSLSLDAESFAWQFSGELLNKAQVPLLYQSGLAPVQVVITINGVEFKMLVERIENAYQFGNRTIRVIGRGLTALLGQPYQQPTSATQGSQLTIQQIAELLLPGGWTLAWHSTMPIPWLIPENVYSYVNQTPIQALAALANDIGCILVPSRNTQTITIMPRYSRLPWNFAQLSPDVVVPASAIRNITHRSVIPTQANGVYINATHNINGQIGWCRLNGTDGARLAPTVSNELMTDAIALRLVGERVLAGQYQQPGISSITLPMDNSTFPMLNVGQFVEIVGDDTAAEGIINSVQLQAGISENDINVLQTITIGEETPNAWALWRELLPRDPLLYATLAETDGTTSLMTLLDNGVVRVRGTGTVNGKYFIRSGKIDGSAPDMTFSEIVI